MKPAWIEIVILALVAIPPTVTLASDRRPLGEVDFFGYKGLDTAAIRSALPFHEGDLFPPAKVKSSDALKRQVSDKVKQVIGREPTGVSFVCCDSKQDWIVYVGLPGESYQALDFNPVPDEPIRLPKVALALREEMDKAWMRAVMKGHGTEDETHNKLRQPKPLMRSAIAAPFFREDSQPLL